MLATPTVRFVLVWPWTFKGCNTTEPESLLLGRSHIPNKRVNPCLHTSFDCRGCFARLYMNAVSVPSDLHDACAMGCNQLAPVDNLYDLHKRKSLAVGLGNSGEVRRAGVQSLRSWTIATSIDTVTGHEDPAHHWRTKQ
jgi:hypothetical protein